MISERVRCRTWTSEGFVGFLNVWIDARPHLDLGDDLLLGGINVSRVHHAHEFWFRALDVGDSCP